MKPNKRMKKLFTYWTVKRMTFKTTEKNIQTCLKRHTKTDEADLIDESEPKCEGQFLLIVSTLVPFCMFEICRRGHRQPEESKHIF